MYLRFVFFSVCPLDHLADQGAAKSKMQDACQFVLSRLSGLSQDLWPYPSNLKGRSSSQIVH